MMEATEQHTLPLDGAEISVAVYERAGAGGPRPTLVLARADEALVAGAIELLPESGGRVIVLSWPGAGPGGSGNAGRDDAHDPRLLYTPEGLRRAASQPAVDAGAFSERLSAIVLAGRPTALVGVRASGHDEATIHDYDYRGLYQDEALEVYVEAYERIDEYFITTERAFFSHLRMRARAVVYRGKMDDGTLIALGAARALPTIDIEAPTNNGVRTLDMLRAAIPLVATI